MISFHKRVKTAYVSLLIVMVVATVAFPILIANLGIYLRKKPLDIRESLSSIPTRLADWSQHGEDQQYGAEMVEELGTPIYLSRNYKRRDEMLNVHVAYYTGIIDDVPHIPERCWAANGNWERVTGYDGVKPIAIEIDGASPSDVPVNRASGEQYDALSILDPVTGVVQEVYLPVGDYQMTVVEFMPMPLIRSGDRSVDISSLPMVGSVRRPEGSRIWRLIPPKNTPITAKFSFHIRARSPIVARRRWFLSFLRSSKMFFLRSSPNSCNAFPTGSKSRPAEILPP